MERKNGIIGALVAFAAIIAVGILSALSLEPVTGASVYSGTAKWILIVGMEAILLSLISAALYFAFQRRGKACIAVPAVCMLVGMANNMVLAARGIPIRPDDLGAAGTAMAVAGGYVLTAGVPVLVSLVAGALGIALCFAIPSEEKPDPIRIASNSLLALVLAFGAFSYSRTVVSYVEADVFAPTTDFYYDPADAYAQTGFIWSYAYMALHGELEEPAGYDADAVPALVAGKAAEYSPSGLAGAAEGDDVVVIMNESFVDLADYAAGFGIAYDGPERFRKLASESDIHGPLLVPVMGGGTCNSELEFLTGCSSLAYGMSKTPYTLYGMEHIRSLAKMYREAGYRTVAVHPGDGASWNRNERYAELGFDEFIDIGGFDGADEFHAGVSDAEVYRKVLSILEDEERPVFVFAITIQNHGDYNRGNIPMKEYGFPQVRHIGTNMMDEFLACIENSDEAIDALVDGLESMDGNATLVFFGDHQPHITKYYAAQAKAEDGGSDPRSYGYASGEAYGALRAYRTDYLVWRNHGRSEGSAWEWSSTARLGEQLAEMSGLALGDLDKAHLAIYAGMPAANALGYIDSSGIAHYADGGDGAAELAMIDFHAYCEEWRKK